MKSSAFDSGYKTLFFFGERERERLLKTVTVLLIVSELLINKVHIHTLCSGVSTVHFLHVFGNLRHKLTQEMNYL